MKGSRPVEDIEVQFVKGVGPSLSKDLAKLGIVSVKDLFYYFPYKYEDRRVFSKIRDIKADNNYYQFKARVLSLREKKAWRGRPALIQALLSDDTGSIMAVWFNQSYLVKLLSLGDEFIFYGKANLDRRFGRQLVSPEVQVLTDENLLSSGRIVPVYSLGAQRKLSQSRMRKIMYNALNAYVDQVPDILGSLHCKEAKRLFPIREALWEIHFPSSQEAIKKARERFIFEEFFLFSMFINRKKQTSIRPKERTYKGENSVVISYLSVLPFEFTEAQKRAISEMSRDLLSRMPMRRLLQGDVGSGKTAVAFYLAAIVLGSGYKCALMVPTEVLANQHYRKALDWFPSVPVYLLSSSLKGKRRRELLGKLTSDEPCMVIGTHALIQPDVLINRLGLVIIDEQHRFGVKQRMALAEKAPDVDTLVMTATPIPRSLAMTLYGDLDITIIDELPPGRQEIETLWITSDKRHRLYKFLREQIEQGRQAYIVYPLVSESDEVNLLAAEQMYEVLRKDVFPDVNVGMVHGKMGDREKKRIMDLFYNGKIQILVATVVIEVGIDVPNATVMVIEHAERFGLSQLHQLRGRIGRGRHRSYCIVVSDTDNEDTRKRLGVFMKYKDGFRLSEADLVLRGPGQFLGERQHGPTEFNIGNPLTDFPLLLKAKRCADLAYKE